MDEGGVSTNPDKVQATTAMTEIDLVIQGWCDTILEKDQVIFGYGHVLPVVHTGLFQHCQPHFALMAIQNERKEMHKRHCLERFIKLYGVRSSTVHFRSSRMHF